MSFASEVFLEICERADYQHLESQAKKWARCYSVAERANSSPLLHAHDPPNPVPSTDPRPDSSVSRFAPSNESNDDDGEDGIDELPYKSPLDDWINPIASKPPEGENRPRSALTGRSGLPSIRPEMSIQNNYQPSKSSPPVMPLTGTIRVDGPVGQMPSAQPKRAFLTVIRGRADLGLHAFIEGRTVLGRDPGCEFPLLDHRVSRRHAAIMPLGVDRYLVQDLGSTNGTRIGGSLIAGPHLLQDGEKILVGESVIRFSLADEIDIDFQSEIAMLVGTDPLTGLPSKRRFDEALEFALQSATQAGGSLPVLMMDMDGVKRINDTFGHLFGAHVIGETGRCIARVLGSRGRACRFGGDEFSAFLPGHDLTAALAIAEQIRYAVETAAMEKDGIALKPTISIGVGCYPQSGHALLDLISKSDEALYRAKSQGKNCVST